MKCITSKILAESIAKDPTSVKRIMDSELKKRANVKIDLAKTEAAKK